MKKPLYYFFLFLGILITNCGLAQNPTRFESELQKYTTDTATFIGQDVIVFTGSSSIKMWHSLSSYFPKYITLNRGFGGSQMHDLFYYKDELIVKYTPKQIFIYEGDNDIAAGKSTRKILKTTKKLVKYLRKQLPNTPIVFISAKPSISRWHLKDDYIHFNKKLKKYCNKKKYLKFADVWSPMIAKNGEPMKDIFIKDNLHLNEKGYQIWAKVIQSFLY
ncbi:MAG: GDSL-type esterase/lipase family protein [Saprospiraceae bacterium]